MHGNAGGEEPARHLRSVSAPEVPPAVRAALDAGDPEPELASAYWVGGVAVACTLVGISLVRSAVTGGGHPLLGWLFLLVVPVLLAVAGSAAARARRRSRRLAARHADRHVAATELAAAASRFPELDARLRRLNCALDRITASEAYAAGWLPGVDADFVDTVRWRVTKDLLATVPLRDALARAAERGRLADQVAQRRVDVDGRDAAADAELVQLDAVVAGAGRVDDLLEDLRVAEELDALDPLTVEARLRQRLPAPAGNMAELAAGAGAVEELLRRQLEVPGVQPDTATAVHSDPPVRPDTPCSESRLGHAEGLQ
jgi:hypothetical protein